jgi:hypothetical protein
VSDIENKNSEYLEVVDPSEPAAGAEPAQREIGGIFSPDEAARLREQWDTVQISFVDGPRHAVEEADSLLALAIKRVAEQFSAERSSLGSRWANGHEPSTEDLRLTLQRYRAFFGKLLSV